MTDVWTIYGEPTFNGDAYDMQVARGFDDEGKPFELRAFSLFVDDPMLIREGENGPERIEGDEAFAVLRECARTQIEREEAPVPTPDAPPIGEVL